MSKGFIGITFLFIGFVAGLVTAATLIEYEINRINKPIDSAIILEIPKTDADLSMSIIYQEAELALLKAIQREGVLETPQNKIAKKSKGPSPVGSSGH